MIAQAHPVLMFLQAFLTQAFGYFTVVGLVFLVVWRWGAKRFAPARIQAKRRFNRKQLSSELLNTLATLAVGTLSALAVSVLYARGATRLSPNGDDFKVAQVLATFVGLVIFNDAWFYAWHRLLHHPKIFRYVHAVHHKSVDVNPFSSYSFHALEGFILGAWVLPAVMVVPMWLPMLGALQAVGLANNVMSHLGYELLPKWFARVVPFSLMNTATFHSLHHTTLNGNYGLQFRWWDKLFGTEVAEYDETFAKRGE